MALTWTDTILPDVTRIKKKHIQEIRDYLDLHINLRTGHPLATPTLDGLMSGTDKANLNTLMTDYVGGSWTAGVADISVTAPLVTTGGATPNLTINSATISAPGAMSAADKEKLDGIQAGAQVNPPTYELPSSLPPTIIAQNDSFLFVTAAEKNNWNSRPLATPSITGVGGTDGLLSGQDKEKINTLDAFPTGTVIMYSAFAALAGYSASTAKPIEYWFNVSDGSPLVISGGVNPFAKWKIIMDMSRDGRMPISAGANYPDGDHSGGSKEHTILASEIPGHRHIVGQYTTTSNNDTWQIVAGAPSGSGTLVNTRVANYVDKVASLSGDGTGGHGCSAHDTGTSASQYVTWTSKKMFDISDPTGASETSGATSAPAPASFSTLPPYYALWFLVKVLD